MRFQIRLIAFIFVALVVSCSDETTIFENPQDSIGLETNQAVLTSSISLENAGVLDIFEEQQLNSGFSRFPNDQAGSYPLELIAQVSPPSFTGGENLTATDIHIDGDYAYISYNTAGADYKGAVDIVNVNDPTSPRLTGRAYSYDKDLNAIHYANGYIYVVGGTDAEQSALATANSVVIKVAASNGRFDTSDLTYSYQEGFNANDVIVVGGGVYVTSGRDGYVTQFDTGTLEIVNEVPYQDLRSVVIKDGRFLVLDATIGVRVLNASLQETSQIQIDSDFRLADKRTLDIMDDKVIVAEGRNGAGVYEINSGSFLEYIPIALNPANVEEADKVTNATAFNEGAILMANGGAGLGLAEEDNGSLNTVGVIELNGSINYVASRGDYIFAASGREGLQVIKMNKPSAGLEARCADSPTYSGSSTLNVPIGESWAYSGSVRFRSVDVAGSLLLCGTWTVRNAVNIADGGLFEMNGTFIVARNNRRRDLTVGQGATFRVEGNLTIYGDLILEDDATLEFIGEDSVVNVFGDVELGDNATVSGTFRDVQDKF